MGLGLRKQAHLTGACNVDLEGHNNSPVLVDPECWVMADIDSQGASDFCQSQRPVVAIPTRRAGRRKWTICWLVIRPAMLEIAS